IGFQETLDRDFEILKARLGLPPGLRLPTDDVGAHRNPSHLDKTLGAQAAGNLAAWYRDDVRFYGLCRQLIAENKIAGPQAKSGFGGSSAC
ncbi:MAG TPA: hypothetical protein VFV81_10585, partial [Verrucomicrobiae bacterium]|nr:hypothetical protein [Verrucomicrobiae bacterium]